MVTASALWTDKERELLDLLTASEVLTYTDIAEKLGYSNVMSAKVLVNRILKKDSQMLEKAGKGGDTRICLA